MQSFIIAAMYSFKNHKFSERKFDNRDFHDSFHISNSLHKIKVKLIITDVTGLPIHVAIITHAEERDSKWISAVIWNAINICIKWFINPQSNAIGNKMKSINANMIRLVSHIIS